MGTLIAVVVVGASAAVYLARRRPWRFRKLEPGSAGRAVIAANLTASRRR